MELSRFAIGGVGYCIMSVLRSTGTCTWLAQNECVLYVSRDISRSFLCRGIRTVQFTKSLVRRGDMQVLARWNLRFVNHGDLFVVRRC